MAHRHVDWLIDSARVHLPGATDDLVRFQLGNVLHDFFSQSHTWREDIRVYTRKGVLDYEITPEEVNASISTLIGPRPGDIPFFVTMPTPGTIKLRDDPGDGEKWVSVVLTTSDALSRDGLPFFPDWVLEKYRSPILEGLLSAMMGQPAKPWTSERLAIFHGQRFRNGVSLARAEADRHNTRGAQRWRFPRFAAQR